MYFLSIQIMNSKKKIISNFLWADSKQISQVLFQSVQRLIAWPQLTTRKIIRHSVWLYMKLATAEFWITIVGNCWMNYISPKWRTTRFYRDWSLNADKLRILMKETNKWIWEQVLMTVKILYWSTFQNKLI